MTRALLTCSPLFHELALNEIRRTHPDLTITPNLIAPGLILLKSRISFDALTRPWRNRLPIYLHHMFPVQSIVALNHPGSALDTLREAVTRIAPSDVPRQVRSTLDWESPYSLVNIRRALHDDTPVATLEAPSGRVVSILVTPGLAGAWACLGVSLAAQNISPWPGGVMPAGECVPNRAGYKLLEALDAFSIRLRRGEQALDLGAAPGAWTTILRRRGLHVTAVAPPQSGVQLVRVFIPTFQFRMTAAMYPWLALDAGVEHQPMRAEEFLGRCETSFDLIVNDMKLDAQDSARLMVGYARHLRPGGNALMTLKLRQEGRLRVMDHALRLLRKAYRVVRVRQLVSNGHEVTLFLRKRT